MRVLVCGGRDFADRDRVFNALDKLNPDSIVQGGARGADALAVQWASARGIPYTTIAARWRLYGGAAGPIRNQAMLDLCKPDLVLAFPGGRGTADMVTRAVAAGIEVVGQCFCI